MVNIALCVSKVILYVFTQSSLILTDAVDSLLNSAVLTLNLYHPALTPLVNYSAIASYRIAYIFVSIDALVNKSSLEDPEILLIASCSMIGAGILLMVAQVFSKEFSNKKMVIIATINDNSSTLGAIVSSSVGFGTGDLQLAGIIDNSLNLAICLLFALFSVFKIIQFVIKDLESSSAVEEDSAQVS